MTSRLNQNIQKLKRAVKGNIVRPPDARYKGSPGMERHD